MRKTILIIIVMIFSMFLVSCDNDPNKDLNTIYTFNENSKLSIEEIEDKLPHVSGTIYVRINLVSEFNPDMIKEMLNDEMSHEEVDELIRNMRKNSKEYFTFLNEAFVNKYALNKYNLNFSQYAPTILILSDSNETLFGLLPSLENLLVLDEVESIDLVYE